MATETTALIPTETIDAVAVFGSGGLDPILDGNHMHRYMPGRRKGLEALQHGEPRVVRQAHVQQDGIGNKLCGQAETFVGTVGNQTAIAEFMCKIEEDMRKVWFIFNYQDATRGERRMLAIIHKARNLYRWHNDG